VYTGRIDVVSRVCDYPGVAKGIGKAVLGEKSEKLIFIRRKCI
jgi:hypothetical protein